MADLALGQVPDALVRLKWPNDVLVDGRKVSGVLIESGARPDGRLWLAVGVGVNLKTAPVAADRPATTLADHLRADVAAPLSPDAALERLAEAFDRRLAAWEAYGFDPIRTAWTARADLGRPCVVRLDQETVEGVAEALDADGGAPPAAGGRARPADHRRRRVPTRRCEVTPFPLHGGRAGMGGVRESFGG